MSQAKMHAVLITRAWSSFAWIINKKPLDFIFNFKRVTLRVLLLASKRNNVQQVTDQCPVVIKKGLILCLMATICFDLDMMVTIYQQAIKNSRQLRVERFTEKLLSLEKIRTLNHIFNIYEIVDLLCSKFQVSIES